LGPPWPFRLAWPAVRIVRRLCRDALPLPGRRHPAVEIGPVEPLCACSAPRVVVGVDSTASSAAIGCAFYAAWRRGTPLIAVSAWAPGRVLEQTLARWRADFLTVLVITKLVCADRAHALIVASPGASWSSDCAAGFTFGDF